MTLVHRTISALAGVVMLAGLVESASAQDIATSFDQLRGQLKPGQTIIVKGSNGRTTRGKLGELSPTEIEILVRETGLDGRDVFKPRPRLSEKDVAEIEIEQSDSLLNGTLIGLAAGGWPWLFCLKDCYYNEAGAEHLLPTIFAYTTAIGAGLGLVIDHSIKDRVTVFLAPERRIGLHIAPILSATATGLQMSFRF